ncbi:hypothetical protein CC86DRAFT_202216 [Ophiobolus disseminans]|uniref:Zn(2)-C6 fungal-type domain-containing protein n=1 Tax=Ophiobolus disseminans TaxID=1469910 RepID=A0A6A7A5J3_9PLEO|nr:hypothetical protein CC86DRAFT_202216 [Ophiobolus disseminans]
MVGVAGRSKGCVTCRKRKKGCDLQQPECSQCKERGIKCGGYDADRVFVYHDGAKRRTGASHTQEEVIQLVQPQPVDSSMQIIATRFGRANSAPLPWALVLPPSLVKSAYGERTMEAFMNLYVPQGNMRSRNAEGRDFVNVLPRLSADDEALRLTVLAIGTVAMSKKTGDANLALEGRKLYCRAIVETQRALNNTTRSKSTPVLAIPRIMALFEILYGAEGNSGKQANSWLSHAEGEMALITARGPNAYSDDDAAHTLFANARFRPLIAAVRTRTRTVLNEEQWKTLPWQGRVKTPNDILLDIMAAIPEILESVDRWGALSSGSIQDEAKDLQTSARCWTLHIKLQRWLALYEHEIHEPVTRTPTPIQFPNFEVATMTTRYWVICLLLYTALDTVSRVPPTNEDCTHPDRPHPRHFARLIARSAEYFFREEFGATGATSIAFPLGNTMLFMSRNPSVDGPYMGLIKKAWSNPNLPNAIKNFLDSLHASVNVAPARVVQRKILL